MTFAEILARQFSLSQYAEFFIRVLIACVCGAAIGFERSKRLFVIVRHNAQNAEFLGVRNG